MSFLCGPRQVGDLSLETAVTRSADPTLVMLHGVTRRWQTFLPVTAALQQRFRLLLVDLRGHGGSDRVAGHYRVTNYVDDICDLIHAHVPGPVVLYGHSLGAMTVAGVAARLGEHISAVVMEDPPLHTMGNRIADTPLLSYFTALAAFAGSDMAIDDLAQSLAEATWSDPHSDELFRIGDTRDAAQLRFAAGSLKRLDPDVLQPVLSASWLDGFAVDDIFAGLKCPALLLQADAASGGMLTDNDAEHLLQLNERLLRVRFPGVGHGIHWTATQSLLNAVLPFLESARDTF